MANYHDVVFTEFMTRFLVEDKLIVDTFSITAALDVVSVLYSCTCPNISLFLVTTYRYIMYTADVCLTFFEEASSVRAL